MATLARTVVATGASSGLGFEAIKQLLLQPRPYRFILGARDPQTTQTAYSQIPYDASTHNISIHQLDLSDLRTVRSFANQTLADLNGQKLDVLFLNAGMNKAATGPGRDGSRWCEAYVVNHLSHHYLTHLLREKIVESKARVVSVSSGLIRAVQGDDIKSFSSILKADSGAEGFPIYRATKFIQFLGAHWWRRQLGSSATVVAVSPGLVGGTGLGRHMDVKPDMSKLPDAISVETGATNLLRAFDQSDLPEDPEQIFLTSWGEWWPKDVYSLSLNKDLQDEWCPGLEEIER